MYSCVTMKWGSIRDYYSNIFWIFLLYFFCFTVYIFHDPAVSLAMSRLFEMYISGNINALSLNNLDAAACHKSFSSVYFQCQVSVSVVYFTWHTSALWDWNVDKQSHWALYSETNCSKTLYNRVILLIQNAKPVLSMVCYSNIWSF